MATVVTKGPGGADDRAGSHAHGAASAEREAAR